MTFKKQGTPVHVNVYIFATNDDSLQIHQGLYKQLVNCADSEAIVSQLLINSYIFIWIDIYRDRYSVYDARAVNLLNIFLLYQFGFLLYSTNMGNFRGV